jgi:hypothetical protein
MRRYCDGLLLRGLFGFLNADRLGEVDASVAYANFLRAFDELLDVVLGEPTEIAGENDGGGLHFRLPRWPQGLQGQHA